MLVRSFHPRSTTVPPEQGMSKLCLRGGIVLNGNSLVGKSAAEPMPAPTRLWNITTITGTQLNHGHWCVSICLSMWPASGRCVSGSPPESEGRMPQCQPPMECSASLPDIGLIPHRQCEDWIYQWPKPESTMRWPLELHSFMDGKSLPSYMLL